MRTLDLADREVALRTREALTEEAIRDLSVGVGHQDEAFAEPQCGLDRVGEARAVGLRVSRAVHHKAVDDDLERVLLHLVERDVLGEVTDAAVNTDPREAAAACGDEELLVLALPIADQRTENEQARSLGVVADLVDDLLHRLRDDRHAVIRAMRHADAREEQTQVVVDLGDRADRRTRVAGRALLVDRDGRRKALDEVDVGLLHLTEELPCVSRERLDVSPLPLGVDRVERERGLARPREPGDDHELVTRDLDVDVLEVVFARALDVDRGQRHYAATTGCVRSAR